MIKFIEKGIWIKESGGYVPLLQWIDYHDKEIAIGISIISLVVSIWVIIK